MQRDLKDISSGPIRLQDFEIEFRLGQGSFGFVLLASRNEVEYALKEMSKYRLKKLHFQHVALIQKQLLRKANHPGMVKSHFAFQTSSKLYLALEVCEGGQFQNLVNGGWLTQQSRRFYLAELVNTIEYLHSIKVTHRDLKPSNIMLTKEGHIKLIDFGTADVSECTILPESFKEALKAMKANKENGCQQQQSQKPQKLRKRRSTFVGTSYFMSPELLQFNYCQAPADLWALGCILYYFYYGHGPFFQSCELDLFNQIKIADFDFPENSQLTPEAEDLIRKLLVKEPQKRLGSNSTPELSFAALKAHPFFSGINVDNIFQSIPPEFVNQEQQIIKKMKSIEMQRIKKPKQINENILLQIFLIKRTVFGDKIFKCNFLKNFTYQQYEIDGLCDGPISYQLKFDDNGMICHVLCSNKLSIDVVGQSRIVYKSDEATSLCAKLNNLYVYKPVNLGELTDDEEPKDV